MESQEGRVEGEIPSMLIIWEGAGQCETPVTESISDQNKCDVASEDIQITSSQLLSTSIILMCLSRDFYNWISILQNAVSGEGDWVAYH